MTLVEIIIIIAIISFLLVLSLAYFRGQIFKGNDARRKADIKRIQIATEEYEKDHNCYPLPQYLTCTPGTGLTPYLNKIPCDPTTGASYVYEIQDSGCPAWYRIYALLENKTDVDSQKQGCSGGCGPGLSYSYYASSPNAPTPQQGSGSTPPPGGNGSQGGFYGCKGGTCVPILWDPNRPGPECDPNYQNSTCYNQCGQPATECVAIKP